MMTKKLALDGTGIIKIKSQLASPDFNKIQLVLFAQVFQFLRENFGISHICYCKLPPPFRKPKRKYC
jgi:hypothetical protein